MDNWVLKGQHTLIKEEQTETNITPSQVKVKVTYAMISGYDAQLFAGIIRPEYPRTLGRFAVGVITEVGENVYGLKFNDRVYLEPARGCGKCIACRSGKSSECSDVKIAGKDFDGFFRDFVVCNANEVAPLPPSVDDLHGVCIETVALAENIYDKLDLSAGAKVAIFGGGFTGTMLAQVAQYHKYIPIMIDNNLNNLDRAKRCGIYYTMTADDELVKNITEATGGQMCDGAVYVNSSKLNPSLPARVLARKRSVAYGGFATANFSIDVRDLMERNARCFTVTDGYGYTDAAINMLVNRAINTDLFAKEIITDGNLPIILDNRLENISTDRKMTVLKFII